MPPRPYQTGKRRVAATEATRAKIVAAARELLADPKVKSFSIDAIAARADVARMTVYYQFKSKAALLEALFDDFGARGSMRNLRRAFEEPDPRTALSVVVEVFCNFWKTQGPLLRKITGFAALDPEIEATMHERKGWRRKVLSTIVGRLEVERPSEVVDVIFALTSLEMFDELSTGRSYKDTLALLQRTIATLVAGR